MPVLLRCPFCHDGLGEDRTICRACLAPHHAACFAEHGRCAANGCAGTRPLEAPAPSTPSGAPPGSPRSAALYAGSAGGIAAALVVTSAPLFATWRGGVADGVQVVAAVISCLVAGAIVGRLSVGQRFVAAGWAAIAVVCGTTGVLVGIAAERDANRPAAIGTIGPPRLDVQLDDGSLAALDATTLIDGVLVRRPEPTLPTVRARYRKEGWAEVSVVCGQAHVVQCRPGDWLVARHGERGVEVVRLAVDGGSLESVCVVEPGKVGSIEVRGWSGGQTLCELGGRCASPLHAVVVAW